jgi:hypothetical protein
MVSLQIAESKYSQVEAARQQDRVAAARARSDLEYATKQLHLKQDRFKEEVKKAVMRLAGPRTGAPSTAGGSATLQKTERVHHHEGLSKPRGASPDADPARVINTLKGLRSDLDAAKKEYTRAQEVLTRASTQLARAESKSEVMGDLVSSLKRKLGAQRESRLQEDVIAQAIAMQAARNNRHTPDVPIAGREGSPLPPARPSKRESEGPLSATGAVCTDLKRAFTQSFNVGKEVRVSLPQISGVVANTTSAAPSLSLSCSVAGGKAVEMTVRSHQDGGVIVEVHSANLGMHEAIQRERLSLVAKLSEAGVNIRELVVRQGAASLVNGEVPYCGVRKKRKEYGDERSVDS